MMILKCEYLIGADKPHWLLRLQLAVSIQYGDRELAGTDRDWEDLRDFVNAELFELHNRRDVKVRSNITTELREDDGKRVLMVLRNRVPVVACRFEKVKK